MRWCWGCSPGQGTRCRRSPNCSPTTTTRPRTGTRTCAARWRSTARCARRVWWKGCRDRTARPRCVWWVRCSPNPPLPPLALAALELLEPEEADLALGVVSVIEATLEDPRPLVFAQQRAARAEAMAAMKAEGWEYTDRMNALEEVTYPQPLA